MENKPFDIKTATVTELKAIAFDVLVQIETNQKNLQIINQEIAKRSNEVIPKAEPDGKKKI